MTFFSSVDPSEKIFSSRPTRTRKKKRMSKRLPAEAPKLTRQHALVREPEIKKIMDENDELSGGPTTSEGSDEESVLVETKAPSKSKAPSKGKNATVKVYRKGDALKGKPISPVARWTEP